MPPLKAAKQFFWRSVTYFRDLKTRATSPYTRPWDLVRLYFEKAQEVRGLRFLILKNFAYRIKHGKFSAAEAERLPPKMLREIVQASNYDGNFLGQVLIEGKGPVFLSFAAESIQKHPESHAAAAHVLLTKKCPESRSPLRDKLLITIARQPETENLIIAQIIDKVTKKSTVYETIERVVIGKRRLTRQEEAAMGKDPSQGPAEFVEVISERPIIAREYSKSDIEGANALLSTHPAAKQEDVLVKLKTVNLELADLLWLKRTRAV